MEYLSGAPPGLRAAHTLLFHLLGRNGIAPFHAVNGLGEMRKAASEQTVSSHVFHERVFDALIGQGTLLSLASNPLVTAWGNFCPLLTA